MIHWITERLGTAAWDQAGTEKEIHLVDTRDLVDRGEYTSSRCDQDRRGGRILKVRQEGSCLLRLRYLTQ